MQPILQDKRGNAFILKSLGEKEPLIIDSQLSMTATGRYNDRRARWFWGDGNVESKGWLMDIGQKTFSIVRYPDNFLRGFTFRTWSAIHP